MRPNRVLKSSAAFASPTNVLPDVNNPKALERNFFSQPTTSTSYFDGALVDNRNPALMLQMRMENRRALVDEVKQNLPDCGEVIYSQIEYARVVTSRSFQFNAEKYKAKIRNIYFGLHQNAALKQMTEAEIAAVRFILLHLYVCEQRAWKYTPLGLLPFNKSLTKNYVAPKFARRSTRSRQSRLSSPERTRYTNEPHADVDSFSAPVESEHTPVVSSARARHFNMLLSDKATISPAFAEQPVDIVPNSRTTVPLPFDSAAPVPPSMQQSEKMTEENTSSTPSSSYEAVSAVGEKGVVWEAFKKAIEKTAFAGVDATQAKAHRRKVSLPVAAQDVLTEVNAETFQAALDLIVPYNPSALRRALIADPVASDASDRVKATAAEIDEESFEARVLRLAQEEAELNSSAEVMEKRSARGTVWVCRHDDSDSSSVTAKLQRLVHSRLAIAKQLARLKHLYDRVPMPTRALAEDKRHFEAVVDSLLVSVQPHPVFAPEYEPENSNEALEFDASTVLRHKKKFRQLLKHEKLLRSAEEERKEADKTLLPPPSDAFVTFLQNLHEVRKSNATTHASVLQLRNSRDSYFGSARERRNAAANRTLSSVLDNIYTAKAAARAEVAARAKAEATALSAARARSAEEASKHSGAQNKSRFHGSRHFSTARPSLASALASVDAQVRAGTVSTQPWRTWLTGSAAAVQREEAQWSGHEGYAPIYRPRASSTSAAHARVESLNSNPPGLAAPGGLAQAFATHLAPHDELNLWASALRLPSLSTQHADILATPALIDSAAVVRHVHTHVPHVDAGLSSNTLSHYQQDYEAFVRTLRSSTVPFSLSSSLRGWSASPRTTTILTRAFSSTSPSSPQEPLYDLYEDPLFTEGDSASTDATHFDSLAAGMQSAHDLRQYYGNTLPYDADSSADYAGLNTDVYESYLQDLKASTAAAAAAQTNAAALAAHHPAQDEEAVFPQGSPEYIHYLLFHHSNRFADDSERHYWMSVSEQVAMYLSKKQYVSALEFINRANSPPRPGSIGVYNALLNSLLNEGMFVEAQKLLEALEHVGIKPNIVTYNIMLGAYSKHGKDEHMAMTLQHMSSVRVPPDNVTYNIVIGQRMREADHMSVRELVRKMRIQGIGLSTQVCNRLIWAYARQQNLDAALKVFRFMYEEQARRDLYKSNKGALVPLYNALVEERKRMLSKDKSGWLQSCGAEIDLNSWVVDIAPDAYTITLLVRAMQARVETNERQLRLSQRNCAKIAEQLLQGNIHTSHAATVTSIYETERQRAESSLRSLVSMCKGQLRLFYELRDQLRAPLSQEVMASLVKSFTFALPYTKHALADVILTAQRLRIPLIIPPAASVALSDAGLPRVASLSGPMQADIARLDDHSLPPTLEELSKRGAMLQGGSDKLHDLYVDKKGLFHINTERNLLEGGQVPVMRCDGAPATTPTASLAAQAKASASQTIAAAAAVEAAVASLIPTTPVGDSSSSLADANLHVSDSPAVDITARVNSMFAQSEALLRATDKRKDALLTSRAVAPEEMPVDQAAHLSSSGAPAALIDDDVATPIELLPVAVTAPADVDRIPYEDDLSSLRALATGDGSLSSADRALIPPPPTAPSALLFNGASRPLDLCAGVLSSLIKATGTKVHVRDAPASGLTIAAYLTAPVTHMQSLSREDSSAASDAPGLAANMVMSSSINASHLQPAALSSHPDPAAFIAHARSRTGSNATYSPYASSSPSPVDITWGETAPTDVIFASLSSLFFDALERVGKGLSLCDPVPLSPAAQPISATPDTDPIHARALLEQVFAIIAVGTAGRIRAVVHTDMARADRSWGIECSTLRQHHVELYITDPTGRTHVAAGDPMDVLGKAFQICQFPVGHGIDRSCIFSILTGLSRLQGALGLRVKQDAKNTPAVLADNARMAPKSPYEEALEADNVIMNKFRSDKRYIRGEVADLTGREQQLLRLFKLFSLRVKLTRTSGAGSSGEDMLPRVVASIQELKRELYSGLSNERPLAEDVSVLDVIMTPALIAQLFKLHTICEPALALNKDSARATFVHSGANAYERMRRSAEDARVRFNATLDTDMEARVHINTAYVSALCGALPPVVDTAVALMGVQLLDNPEQYNINGMRKADAMATMQADPSQKHASTTPLSVFDNVTPPPMLATLGVVNWTALQQWANRYRFDPVTQRSVFSDAPAPVEKRFHTTGQYALLPATLDAPQMPAAPAYTLLLQCLVRLQKREAAQGVAGVLETVMALDLEEVWRVRRGEVDESDTDAAEAEVRRRNDRMQVALDIDGAAPFEEYPMLYSACMYAWKSARAYDHAIAVAEMLVARRGPAALTEKMYVDVVECCMEGATIALDRERTGVNMQRTAAAVVGVEDVSALTQSVDYLHATHVVGDGYQWTSMDYVWKALTLTRAYVTACRKSSQPPLLQVVARAVRLGVRHGLEEPTIALMSELSPALFKLQSFSKNKVVAGISAQPGVVDVLRQALKDQGKSATINTSASGSSAMRAYDVVDVISSLQSSHSADDIFTAVQQSSTPFTHLVHRNTGSSMVQLGVAWALVAHEVLLQVQEGNTTSVSYYREPEFHSYLQKAIMQDAQHLSTRFNHLDFSVLHIRSNLRNVFADDDYVESRRSITYRTRKHERMSPQALRATLVWVLWCWKQALFKGIGLVPRPSNVNEWLSVSHVAGRDTAAIADINSVSSKEHDDELAAHGTIGYGSLRAKDIYRRHMRAAGGSSTPADLVREPSDELEDMLSLPRDMDPVYVNVHTQRGLKHLQGRSVTAPEILDAGAMADHAVISALDDDDVPVQHSRGGVVLLSRMLEGCSALPFVFNTKLLLLYARAFSAWKTAEADALAAQVPLRKSGNRAHDHAAAMLELVKTHKPRHLAPHVLHIMHLLRKNSPSAADEVAGTEHHGDTDTSVLKAGVSVFHSSESEALQLDSSASVGFHRLPPPEVKRLTEKMHEKDIFFPALETAYHVFYSIENPYTVDQVQQMLKICYSTLLELRLLYAQTDHFSRLEQRHSHTSPALVAAEIDYMRVVEKATYRPRRFAMDMISRILSLIANDGFVPLSMLDAFFTREDIQQLRARKTTLSNQTTSRNAGLKRIQWQNHGVALDEYESVMLQELFARVRLEQETLKRAVKWYKDYAKKTPEWYVLRHFSSPPTRETSPLTAEEEELLSSAEDVNGVAALRAAGSQPVHSKLSRTTDGRPASAASAAKPVDAAKAAGTANAGKLTEGSKTADKAKAAMLAKEVEKAKTGKAAKEAKDAKPTKANKAKTAKVESEAESSAPPRDADVGFSARLLHAQKTRVQPKQSASEPLGDTSSARVQTDPHKKRSSRGDSA